LLRSDWQRPAVVVREQGGAREPAGKTSFSEELVNGTMQRLSAPSQRHQCGEATLRMLVTQG
jgi:hypothetical protein